MNTTTSKEQHEFRIRILTWAATQHRPMPWKGERDPYKIWLSEIILQQTRVEQGLPYYERFVARYPTIDLLAAAPEDELFKMWEGLGYYSRARNLHATAQYIAQELGGQFPDTYEAIRALKGVGDYTAAAIASFAYGLPYAVLDGNVYRVLARYFGIDTPSDSNEGKKTFGTLAQAVLAPEQAGVFNQAMMDFGATHCTPALPKCGVCMLQSTCAGYAQNKVLQLPVKGKKQPKRGRYFIYVVFQLDTDTLVRKRSEKDIWKNLYEFPLIEMEAHPADEDQIKTAILAQFFPEGLPKDVFLPIISKKYQQTLTHQLVSTWFCTLYLPIDYRARLLSNPVISGFQQVHRAQLTETMAVPRVIAWFLSEKPPELSLF